MARKEVIYLLDSSPYKVVVISPPDTTPSQVHDEWALSIKRAEAKLTLSPKNRPDRLNVCMAAIADLQERQPAWNIIYGPLVHITVGNRPNDRDWAIRFENDKG
jgi:hypothetical protein